MARLDSGAFTGRYILYRFFDDACNLVYVGQTCNLNPRIDSHRHSKDWWHEVADCRVEFLPDQASLDEAEWTAVITEHPRRNRLQYKIKREGMVRRGLVPAKYPAAESVRWGPEWDNY